MPQMAPISWLTLFIIFSITLIIFSILNYFSFNQPAPLSIKSSSFKPFYLSWKW